MIAWLLVLGSIVTSAITKRRTDLQVGLSNFVKKKHLIKELSEFGITSSYNEYLLFNGWAAYASMEHEFQKVRSARENHKLIQGVADNFDCSISSPNGLKQTHSKAVIMTQEHISTCMSDSALITYIVNQSKIFNIINFQMQDLPLQRSS